MVPEKSIYFGPKSFFLYRDDWPGYILFFEGKSRFSIGFQEHPKTQTSNSKTWFLGIGQTMLMQRLQVVLFQSPKPET